MPICALYFPESFSDKNWAGITYAIESVGSREGISRSGEWLLGRHPAADLTFAIKDVSRRHAAIAYSYANNIWTISDLGSATGTRVRGKALAQGNPEPINVGDRIWLGANQIIVVEDEGDTVGGDKDVGESTIADTKPLDHRPQVEPPAPPILHPQPAPPILLPQPPKTYADTVYLALQWTITPTTALGVAVRLVLVAVATVVLVLWLD